MTGRSLRVSTKNGIDSRESIEADVAVICTDSNCSPYKAARDRIERICEPLRSGSSLEVAIIIPEPHIERWLLLDSNAFRSVFGRGCDPPDKKCERGRYKSLLMKAIIDAGIKPPLGGIEFSEDIVNAMNMESLITVDESFGKAVKDVRDALRRSSQTSGGSPRL